MNHFAHARVAAAHAADPLFALGAMLPDFASMLRERFAEPEHPALRAGVRLHHASDAVFHAAPEFVALVAEASAQLREAGVARGSARGAAHVGIELLVDASLAQDAEASRAYRSALAAAKRPEVAASIAWRRAEAVPRWRALHARLISRGAPRPDATAEDLALRVARALAPRPRLALDLPARTAVGAWLHSARAAVHAATPALLQRVVEATLERVVEATLARDVRR